MEIKTTSTRVIKTAETTTENAKYVIEYESDGTTLTRMSVNITKYEEVEFPMEDGMHTDTQETYVGNIYYDNGSYSMSNFPGSKDMVNYISEVQDIAESIRTKENLK